MNKYNFVVLTISDTCSSGIKTDVSGPRLVECINSIFPNGTILTSVLPDEEDAIVKSLVYYCDVVEVDVILTTGGTGFSKRDVTPEATRKVVQRFADGISTALMVGSINITPMAMLSRLVCGIRGKTLIVNFPGSAKAVVECFNIIKKALPHAIELLKENIESVRISHDTLNPKNSPSTSVKHSCHHKGNQSELMEMSLAKAMIKDRFLSKYLLKTEKIPSLTSCGYVTAETIFAKEPFPPFEAAIKDGYACLFEDGKGRRKVQYYVSAGDNLADSSSIERGFCSKINTGASIPPGANCVVMV
jgi:gephyrin